MLSMTDIAVIILVGQDNVHIGRCLDRLAALDPRQVFVVESQPADGTGDIARQKGATTVFHQWPGIQSIQFNWAIDNLPIEAEWILRLDVDEYLTKDTIERIKVTLTQGLVDVSGVTLELRRKFCGGEIRHATAGIRQVRLFRKGRARYADSLMDERLDVDGEVADFDGAFYDDNLNSMDWWREKHRGYAKREAAQALAGTYPDPRKAKYYRLPPYFRAVAYFCLRYFLKGGFLDGYAGWMWNFWQGLWYRWIVDREIGRIKRSRKRCR